MKVAVYLLITQANIYVTGYTDSPDFPLRNPIMRYGGNTDAFVIKISPEGRLLFSSYIGGGGFDSGNGIVVDTQGDFYLTGSTESVDFPTRNPLQAKIAGSSDAFVMKVDAEGRILFSTFIGGNSFDSSRYISLDSKGYIHYRYHRI